MLYSWTTPSGCCVRRTGFTSPIGSSQRSRTKGESPEDRAEGLGALIRSWMDEEGAGEQRETIEYLVHALDEGRLRECSVPVMAGHSGLLPVAATRDLPRGRRDGERTP